MGEGRPEAWGVLTSGLTQFLPTSFTKATGVRGVGKKHALQSRQKPKHSHSPKPSADLATSVNTSDKCDSQGAFSRLQYQKRIPHLTADPGLKKALRGTCQHSPTDGWQGSLPQHPK